MSHFFAYLSKMKTIQRWGLMRNACPENTQEHSYQAAVIAHALAVICNERFGGKVDPARTALLALFHDAGEVITGDLPTPIKYFNPQIEKAYGELDVVARKKLLGMLPAELRPVYRDVLTPTAEKEWKLVKAADKICAYLKCLEEARAGNREFRKAEAANLARVKALKLREVDYFVRRFVPSFKLTLDELN